MEMFVISRNSAYYLNVFKKLDEGHDCWNWAAFCFQGMWMFYRKMYLYGLFSVVIDFTVFFSVMSTLSLSSAVGLSFVFRLAYKCLYGYFGNRIYYSVVKERIADGYHLMNQYKSTSKSLAILFLFLPSIYFYYLADILANDAFFKNRSRKNIIVNEENIVKYLSQDKTNHIPGKIAIIASVILYLMSYSFVFNIYEQRFKVHTHKIDTKITSSSNDHIEFLE